MCIESRTSNTELVSVQRDTIERAAGVLREAYEDSMAVELEEILEQPDALHQGELLAYQIRSKTDRPESEWTPWRECCDIERAMHSSEVGRFNRFGIMREIRPVYAGVAPSEVEQLRADLATVKADRDSYAQIAIDLRAQLAERDAALLNSDRYQWLREHAVRIQGSQTWYQGKALDIRVDVGRDRMAEQAKHVQEGRVLIRHQPE